MISDEFNIYTREAGPGVLSVSVEGPSKAKMDVVDRGHGYTTVSYIVDKPGRSWITCASQMCLTCNILWSACVYSEDFHSVYSRF